MFSLVIPVYRSEASLPRLIESLAEINRPMAGDFEAVLVVDGSPDRSYELLLESLPGAGFASRLVLLSRNFGGFPAVRAGLEAASGDLLGVMTADGQEPISLIVEFRDQLLAGECDVVVGSRTGRSDPLLVRVGSRVFWSLYRRFVQREVPRNGVDVFAVTSEVRDRLLALKEHNSTLVGLLFWLGFRRREIEYERLPRREGRSAWTLARRLRYLLDSTFAFSDLPIRLLSVIGLLGLLTSIGLGSAVGLARLMGDISVPGYAATVIVVMFFGGLNSFGLGLIGEYLWRTFENTKNRPLHVIARSDRFEGGKATG